jgi:tRNA threonylcarbamoyladenosine biosynthesis protein TsaB|tara:strand:+ start:179 stop:562 length:384 start_codon:yes stop_codon:yes gene_type:complete
MMENFLIINCIGKNDKLGLRINKEFFVHTFKEKENVNEKLVQETFDFLEQHKVELNEKFSVIVNQGPGSFSGIRISLAIAKGLEISKKVRLYGYIDNDLQNFDLKNIEKLIDENLTEKNLIKPIYLS